MTIHHIVDSLDIGGAETLVAVLCRLHHASGHSITVHCLFEAGARAEELRSQGIGVRVHGPARRWKLIRRLWRALHPPPDVVHCHNRLATIVGAPVARLAGAGAVLSTRHGIVGPAYSRRREFQFWMAARCCDRVVAVCSAAHRNLAGRFGARPERVVTIRTGTAPAPAGGDGEEPASTSGFTLVHVARLMWKKDQGALLRAVAAARPAVTDVRLWIIGDGPDRSALEALARTLGIQDCVVFLGMRPDVGRWLAAGHVFVLSSLTEGIPVSLLEAMAAGLPFIATEVGGVPEVASLAEMGLVVPSGSPEALAAAIVECSRRREELPALGRRARECYQRYFTPDRMAREHLRVYREILRRRGRLPVSVELDCEPVQPRT
jgi:glycosyltransferase involved in cell wall biosynthesis